VDCGYILYNIKIIHNVFYENGYSCKLQYSTYLGLGVPGIRPISTVFTMACRSADDNSDDMLNVDLIMMTVPYDGDDIEPA